RSFEVSRNVLHQLASLGSEPGGQKHGREIRTATAKRNNRAVPAACEKTRNHDDATLADGRLQMHSRQTRTRRARLVLAGELQTGFMHVQTDRRDSDRFEMQREERNR